MQTTYEQLKTELLKVAPLLALLGGYALYYGDTSQYELALYYLTVLLTVLTIMQVVRKFMFPTFSVEAHMTAALEGKMAAAVVVMVYFAFLYGLCYLLTLFVQANIRPPV